MEPVRAILRHKKAAVKFYEAEATSIDPERKVVKVFDNSEIKGATSETEVPYDSDLESLRSEFVAGFNARDLDAVLAVVASDVECPDRQASGARELAVELAAIWDRSPGALLTPALLDGTPCAVAWLPDAGSWCRAALVCFDAEDGLLAA